MEVEEGREKEACVGEGLGGWLDAVDQDAVGLVERCELARHGAAEAVHDAEVDRPEIGAESCVLAMQV